MKTTGYKYGKVLVLGIDERSALTVIRSLGRNNLTVHLGYDNAASVCKYSKYVAKAFQFPDAKREPELWLSCLENRIKYENYDLVIPTADNYLVLIVRNRKLMEKHAKFAIPSDEGFQYTYDKNKTFELANLLGIPCPKTKLIENVEEIGDIHKEFRYPVVIKPISSKVWKDNVRHSLKVEVAKGKEDLELKLSRLLKLSPVLLQSFHKGVGVGIELLMSEGYLVAAFQHERIHEPLKGGGSSYRKSVALDPVLLDHSIKLMRALKWTGVAMVEYKYDRNTGQSVLMEINGRFWGSLPLAVNAGVDFPSMLYDMLAENRRPIRSGYKKNIFCRNIARDIDWFIENLTADKEDPLKISVPITRVVSEIKHLITFKEHYDTLPYDDLNPGIVWLFRYLLRKTNSFIGKIRHKLLKMDQELNLFTIGISKRRFKNLAQTNPSVLFMCKGNICRSPFAEYYLRKMERTKKTRWVKIQSAGLLDKPDRKSPENALDAAASFRIDLSSHRSKVLTRKMVEQFDVIMVMDIDLFHTMKLNYPDQHRKLFFLGQMRGGYPKQIEIQDPYGQSYDSFVRIYSQISQSLESMEKIV